MKKEKRKAQGIKELKKELAFLYRVTRTVSSLSLDEVFHEIIAIADEVTKGDSCFVYLLDEKTKTLILRASKNPHDSLLRKIKLRVGEGITGWVAKEQQAVVIARGANRDPRFKLFRNLPEDRFEAFLSVPIINKRGVVGVINVQHETPHEFSQTEVNLLSAIGKLIGGAVENALLVEETLELKEALELRKTIEKAKGLLMKRKNVSEDRAYRMLQQKSMNSRKSLREVAEAIVLAEDFS